MTGFHNVVFPLSLAFGASGGPERRTDIITLASGGEHRNSPHAHSRRRYNAGAGIKSLDDVHRLITFFEARRGQLHAFRFKDPLDHKSCLPSANIAPTDQMIGESDGEQTTFALVKNYLDDAGGWSRSVTKPVVDSVVIAVDGTPLSATDFTVDDQTGEVNLITAPSAGQSVSAGFVFHVPVRFDTDALSLTLESFGAGEMASIPLIEVRDYENT